MNRPHITPFCMLLVMTLLWPVSALSGERRVPETYEHHVKAGYSQSIESVEFTIDSNIIGLDNLDTTVKFEDTTFNRVNLGYKMLGRGVFDDLVPRVFVEIDVSGGVGEADGFTQDSYDKRPAPFGNNEQYSAITSDGADSYAVDAQLTVAFEFDLPVKGGLFIRPEAGFFKSYRKFTAEGNGYEHLDPFGWSLWPDYYSVGPIADWTAEYYTDMIGGWGGIALGTKPTENLSARVGYRFYDIVDYKGEGSEWTTEQTKVQPGKSFEHNANGEAHAVNASATWDFAEKWQVTGFVEYKKATIGEGDHKIYMVPSGFVREQKLKEAISESLFYGLNVEYRF